MKIAICIKKNDSDFIQFSAHAIKAVVSKFTYIITYDSNIECDYLLVIKNDIMISNANEFVKLIELELKDYIIQNDNIQIIPKNVKNPSNKYLTSNIKKTYIVMNDSNVQPVGYENIFWAYNTEQLILTSRAFDTVVCVASGLIPLYMATNINGVCDVHITDINQNCLNFQKELFENVHNIITYDHYKNFVHDFSSKFGINIAGDSKDNNFIFDKVITNAHKIKSCRIHFLKSDLRNPSDQIAEVISKSRNPLVCFSNIFSYVPTSMNGSSVKEFLLFLNILLGSNLNASWYGDTPKRINSTNVFKQKNIGFSNKINIDFPYEVFYNEIMQLEQNNLFVKHRSNDGYKHIKFNRGWYSFCLHGISYNMTQGAEHYGYDDNTAPYHWTDEALEYCPTIVNWFKDKAFKKVYHRVRIMKLEPNGFIGIHNDNSNPKSFATNMAINNPSGCEMHFLDTDYKYLGQVPWKAGDIYKLQVGLNHYVVNKSNKNRYHFIIHGSDD